MSNNSAAPAVAKRQRNRKRADGVHTLSTGVKVKLHPVAISLINEAQAAIPNPPVPTVYIEDKDRHEPNPNDPAYVAAVTQAEADRNVAAVDAMILFGVELLEGIPEDGDWVKKLRLRQRIGITKVRLEDFDLEDPIDREFVFKKYVAVAVPDLEDVMRASNVTEEDIAEATRTFRGDEAR